MNRLAPVGDVYQAGTLSGNPLATAAGLSVLRRLRDPAVYEELERRSARLEEGLAPFGRVQRVGAMLTFFCGTGARERVPAARHGDATARSSGTCSTEGIYVAPSQYECLFPSLAHGDDEIDETVAAVACVLRMSELVGKRVLIGITCVGPNGAEVDRFQTHGVVEIVGNERIGVRREGLERAVRPAVRARALRAG